MTINRGSVTLGAAAQMGASAVNFLLVLSVVRAGGLSTIGAFAIAYGVSTFMAAMARAAMGDALTVHHVDLSSRASLAPALIRVAGLAMTPLIPIGIYLGSTAGEGWYVIAATPVLTALELGRTTGLGIGRRTRVFLAETLRLSVQMGVFILGMHRNISVTEVVALWSAGLILGLIVQGGVFGGVQLKEGISFLIDSRRLSISFGLDVLLASGIVVVADILLALVASSAVLGAIRAIAAPMNVVTVGIQAVSVAVLPLLVKNRHDEKRTQRARMGISILLTTLALLVVASLAIMPEATARKLFGDAWIEAEALVPWVGAGVVGWALAAGPVVVARALGQGTRIVQFRATIAPLQVFATPVGAYFAGSTGAGVGLAVVGAAAAGGALASLGKSQPGPRRRPWARRYPSDR